MTGIMADAAQRITVNEERILKALVWLLVNSLGSYAALEIFDVLSVAQCSEVGHCLVVISMQMERTSKPMTKCHFESNSSSM